jgi:multiple sugar transport system permease protein
MRFVNLPVAAATLMTGALLGAAPPLIIYAFLMDYYIAGLTAGATKG